MHDLAQLTAQFVLTGCLAVWMIFAVFNNWRFPRLNEEAVGMVMRFDLMAEEYPEDYAVVAHRRIENPRIIRFVFRLMVLTETAAAVLLCAGAALLAAALLGFVPVPFAQLIALFGTLIFVMNWTGFVVGGEYFCYWYCHFGSQATHMLLALWGTLVSLILVL